jgi:hypothetical protein
MGRMPVRFAWRLPPLLAVAARLKRLVCVWITALWAVLGPLHAQTELQKAVGEFKSYTQSSGMRTDAAPKSSPRTPATPRWHGRLYENFRNDYLDAVPHEITQRGGTKSLLRRNQFGFSATGPLAIPGVYDGGGKTFVSVSYEGVRDSVARSFLQTMPTVPERTGNFSAVVDQAGRFLPIFDSRSTRRNPSFDPSIPVTASNLEYLRTPFPANRIDASLLDPVALRFLDYYPSPNASVGPFDRNNYFLVTPESNDADGGIFKVERIVGERHRLSADLSLSNGFLGTAARLPTAADPAASDRRSRNRTGAVRHVFTKSPNTVNSFLFQADSRVSEDGEQGTPDYAGDAGLQGSSALAFPNFSLSPYVAMGHSYPQSRSTSVTYTVENDFSTKQGSVTLRVSARHIRYQVSGFRPAYPAGSFRFGEGLTSLPGVIGTGHAFASFLLGMAEYANKSYVVSPSYFRRHSTSLTVSEKLDPTPGFSLTLQLGITHNSPRYEKYDRQSTVDLSVMNPENGRPGAMVVAGLNGQGRAFQPQFLALEPAASLTWNVGGDAKTVLRADYSRSYEAPWISSIQWATQAFNAEPIYLSPNMQLDPAVRLAEGLPPLATALPDVRPEALNDTNADLVHRSSHQPVYQSATLTLEREMPWSTLATIGASYSGGRDIFVDGEVANLNAIRPEALAFRDMLNDESFQRSLRPYPQYKSLNVGGLFPLGRYFGSTFFASVEKRASAGLSLNFRYDLARQFDDYSAGRQDYFNRHNEWSSSYLYRHRFTLTYMYELPFGRGRFLGFQDWRRHVLGGWSLSGSSSYSTGYPFTLYPQFNNTGDVIPELRVNVVPGVNPLVPNPGPELWFNPAAFDQPADFTMGNAARTYTSLCGPPSQNHDLSLRKRFVLGRGATMEFSALALNFLNHANWNYPDPVIGPLSAPNVNAGKIIGSAGGRVLQLGLRLSF